MWFFLWLLASLGIAKSETGRDAWLRYAPLNLTALNAAYTPPVQIVALNSTQMSPVWTAGAEVKKGLLGIFQKDVLVSATGDAAGSTAATVVIGTVDDYAKVYGGSADATKPPKLDQDGFWLDVSKTGPGITILGQNERGALYGAFEYLSLLAQANFSRVAYASNPSSAIRWVNHWDNMDGSIERGYAGPSIFFKGGSIVSDMAPISEYGRILASIGVNAIIINNVNADANILSSRSIDSLGKVGDALRPWGVQLGISLNFASPKNIGGLSNYDPLDSKVIAWWTDITNKIYARVPDFAGYLVKANSEGQPGPQEYKRSLSQAANLFAKALKPHGGIIMFRAFVYDHNLSEGNWKNDRANAAVEFFKSLDGQFDDNVVVQIKYGPIDFQVREPVSPLFATLKKMGMAMELQVSQEYFGQQSHFVYLAPMWKEILDFDLRIDGKPALTRDVTTGKYFGRTGGFAAVVNVGTNTNWLGHHLALANLYAYGKLAWDPSRTSEAILQEWIRMTFSRERVVIDTITKMSMQSWPAYENYTGNLGIQTLTDIIYTHFGPNPSSMDGNGWGQWTRADGKSIGMDRTVSNGTSFAGQYPREVAERFEKIETTPDELLLWFHHVPYTQRLKSGKTVIQHFYNAHYAGAETAQTFLPQWETLKPYIDQQRFDEVAFRLAFQTGHSVVWRDAICEFYRKLSGIQDEEKRVGTHPWRVEAENMRRQDFSIVNVSPAVMASGGVAVQSSRSATVSFNSTFPTGNYSIAVNYFDMSGEKTQWRLSIGGTRVGEWTSDNEVRLGHAMSNKLDGHSATRFTVRDVKVNEGDECKLSATPSGGQAAVDYVAFLPHGVLD